MPNKDLLRISDITLENGQDLLLSLKEEQELNIFIKDNYECNLKLVDLTNRVKLNFELAPYSKLNVKIINPGKDASLIISGNVKDEAICNFYCLDLDDTNSKIDMKLNLVGFNSKGSFIFSSVSNENNIKKYDISFDQKNKFTESLLEGYTVSLKNGEFDTKGISHIYENGSKSIANQRIKSILFDKESKAKASPTLKIDIDDIVANHGCAIGSLNADHIYYLKTRGLSDSEARKLITIGYLVPIQQYLNKEEIEEIEKKIKEVF